MAIVTGPLHSSEARGQIGGKNGLVYNTYRGRCYVKANALPKTEYSDPQVTTRAIANDVHDLWVALSIAQRNAWDDFADRHPDCCWSGRDKRLSGWNWFMRANFRLLIGCLPTLTDPPFPVTSYILEGLSYTLGTLSVDVFWTPLSPAPDPAWNILIWRTSVHLPTVHPSFKLSKLFSFTYEQDASQNIPAPDSGTYTIYFLPVSDQGITMPPARLIVTVP